MESTLSIQLSDLAQEVGHYLGYGRTAANWSGWDAAKPYVPTGADTQLGWIMASVEAGYRQFLYPKLADQAGFAYEWSFLTPERSLALIAGKTDYDLPDDFRDLVGELTYQPADSTWVTIREGGIGEVRRRLQQAVNLTTKPDICAIVPKPTDGTTPQRYAMVFAPIPDAAYTLSGRWSILPQALSVANPWPLGGSQHGETLLESCLAVAESRFNEDRADTHKTQFEERLRASIALDREFRPAYWGQNLDRSDLADQSPSWNGGWQPLVMSPVSYNGVVPG